MTRTAPRPLATALDQLVSRLAPATTLGAVQSIWEAAVGPAVAAHARPVFERDGILRIVCDSAVWAHELELGGPRLAERLNGALGSDRVRGVRCQTATQR